LLALNASLNCTNDIFGRGLQRARAGRRAGRWERRERTSADGEDAFPAHASCVCANERAPPLARANKKQSYTRVHETNARGRLAAACAEGAVRTRKPQPNSKLRERGARKPKRCKKWMGFHVQVLMMMQLYAPAAAPRRCTIYRLGSFIYVAALSVFFFSLTAVLSRACWGERKQRSSLDSQRQWTRSRRRRLPRPTSPV
jgi:hypothetical protein